MTEKLKVCLVGATGVGKTSLVARYVRSIFSDVYQTTIGVAIERRDVQRGDTLVQLVIWDLSGEDDFQNVQPAYLRGAAGYALVIDGTRPETVDAAMMLEARVRSALGAVPFVVAVNKSDLELTWQIGGALDALRDRGWRLVSTSAKTGAGVEGMFTALVDEIRSQRRERSQPWI